MKIVIATLMDWDALYIDGVNEQEAHTLCACDLIIALEGKLPCTIESMEIRSVDEGWWCDNEGDGYPRNIEDVVFEKGKDYYESK